jgi:site-specific recombinase XerD
MSQLPLHTLPSGKRRADHTIDFNEIRKTEARIMRASKAPNTHASYTDSWKAFCAWCQAVEQPSLPAAPGTLRDFLTWSINQGYRLSTVTSRVCAIAHFHKCAGFASPYDASVKSYLVSARRDLREEPAGKLALTYEMLRRIAGRFPETPVGIRNRTMILIGFASGWRRSELIALRYADVTFVPQGLTLWQRCSKVDQIGEGRLVGITPGTHTLTCPITAMRAWLAVRGDWQGQLFVRANPYGELTRQAFERRGETLNVALKRMLEQIGENPHHFGAHSLRSGMITEAAIHGASDTAIKQRTGHKCLETIQRYIRPASIFDFDPLKDVL